MRLLNTIMVGALGSHAVAQITGITAGVNHKTGERPSRRNIDDIYREGGPPWDLLIQSLALMQEAKEDDPLSYYQISGIHGLPFKGWQGVEQVPGGAKKSGFCPHGQVNFIPWHRPFLALFEQTLQRHAQIAANQYPANTSGEYQLAARDLRFPFWDWASSPALPEAVTNETFIINTPQGRTSTRNPLYSYQFQHVPFQDADFHGELAQYNETMRCVERGSGSSGSSNFGDSTWNLTEDGGWMKDQVYAVFTQSTTFEQMASTANGAPSFENPHNKIHEDVACYFRPEKTGHMGDVHWSAFDPLFFLHHANVDRLVAMWQAIYYNNTMFTGHYNASALFGTAPGPVGPDDPLKPFTDGNGVYYTPARVASTRAFGYTYPELEDWAARPEELRRSVMQRVNALYGPRSGGGGGGNDTSTLRRRWWGSRRRRAGEEGEEGMLNDYAALVTVDRGEMELPARFDFYLDGTPVGTLALLGMPTTGVVTSSVALRWALARANVKLDDAQTVATRLRKEMSLVIRNHNGTVPTASVPSLHIEIQQRGYTPSERNDEFPTYNNILRNWEVEVDQLPQAST